MQELQKKVLKGGNCFLTFQKKFLKNLIYVYLQVKSLNLTVKS